MRPGWIVSACLGLFACGGDDAPPVDAAPPGPDAPVDAAPPSALGQVCVDGDPLACPADYTCEIRGAIGGSADTGYCSPICSSDPDCTAGYTGPGTPTCLGNACILVCTDACPSGLTCLPTGGPTDICAVAE
ncbi:MAG: hypothetical protein R2939_06275 [Kofleriaceae bacterium]